MITISKQTILQRACLNALGGNGSLQLLNATVFLISLSLSPNNWAAPAQPAINACSGLNNAASCSFQSPNGTINGTCQTVENQFACVPRNQPSTPPTSGTTTNSTPTTGTTTTTVAQGTIIGNTGGSLPDTGQTVCYNTAGNAMSCPTANQTLYGQDAQYEGNTPRYINNGDGTISDSITGLMWQQDPDRNGDGSINSQDMLSFDNAVAGASSFRLAGYNDWRLPTIKELYSLINFNGTSPSTMTSTLNAIPYLDTNYFKFAYGDTAAGLRSIDAQYWSSTKYVSTTMNGQSTAFGVNFADGRIKGYPTASVRTNDNRYVRYVRGNNQYGVNHFINNGDTTITDNATGLMWLQNDSGSFKPGSKGDGSVNWEEALAWCEGLTHAGHSDWRLPNAKELQSLVDYTRSPATTASAAIDPMFNSTAITDEGGKRNYPSYWTSTTHRDGPNFAVYIAFGEALGCMSLNGSSTKTLMDVHGAGAQRSDPKTSTGVTLGCGNGPQGDIIRVYNYARCVRTAGSSTTNSGTSNTTASYDATNQTLTLPSIDAGNLGTFQANLKLVADPNSNWVFEVTNLTPVTVNGAASASFNSSTDTLSIPIVMVGTRKHMAQLKWLRSVSSSTRFQLMSVQ